jgi:acyl dehydratase
MTAMTVLDGEAEVRAAVGNDLGTTDWYDITAAKLDSFVTATGDADGTYFAISLSNMFLPQIVEVRGFALGVNYGTQTVTFGTALRDGDRARGRAALVDVTEVKNGLQTLMVITVERERAGENVGAQCVIESLSRWLNPHDPETMT